MFGQNFGTIYKLSLQRENETKLIIIKKYNIIMAEDIKTMLGDAAERKQLSPEKLKALQLTMDKIDKTYGRGSIMKLGDENIENIEVTTSGSIGLNYALGVGG
mgnify:FL=1